MKAIVNRLTVEYLHQPLGIDEPHPRLGWTVEGSRRGVRQTAYQIMVASSADALQDDKADVWDSGKVYSDHSVVAYAGKQLQSDTAYYWKVRIWDEEDRPSDWSQGYWSMGLLRRDEWKGRWIGLKSDIVPNKERQKPSVYLRKTFHLDKPIERATLYATALGLYVCHLNGGKVGDEVFAPEFTDYNTRVYYQTYDVTERLKEGINSIGLTLGQGWYAGFVGLWDFQKYGTDPFALLQLNIVFKDGSRAYIATDESWKASFGPIVSSDLIMGEIYDAQLEMPGWNEPHYDDSAWRAPDVHYDYKGYLSAQCSPGIKVTRRLAPQSVTKIGERKFIVDMGQNMVGRIIVKLPADTAPGTRMTFCHGEVLTREGELYTDNLRNTKQLDVYVANGSGHETYAPTFTFHGFRYVEVDGYPGELTADRIVGEVIHSAMEETGVIETSNPMVNRLFSNIVWTQRGNFLSVPTDCPQRDERAGWMGDAQIYSFTASYNMDVAAFFKKWMIDVEDAQKPTGAFTDVSPHLPYSTISAYPLIGSSGWADAGVIIPWNMYRIYGDTRILERHYEAMSRWIRYNQMLYPQHVRRNKPQYGDWLSIATPDMEEEAHGTPRYSAFSTTPIDVFGTAYYAYVVGIMRDVAAVLGRKQDADKYAALFEEIKMTFNREFVDEDARIKGHTQTAYAMALFMDLLPENKRKMAARHLVSRIESQDWHITTGIHGIRFLLPVLSDYGYDDVAYRLLLQDTYPSWMYTIKQGATTIWERWDGWTEERGFQNPLMNSFNHYALGSVGEWMYRYMGGIEPAEPGYSKITIRPRVNERVPKVDVRYRSIKGEIVSGWELTERGELNMRVTVPANTTAEVFIPLRYGSVIREGGEPIERREGIVLLERKEDCAVYRCESGEYRFTIRKSEEQAL